MTGLFVYGTLMPGHLRWPMVADDAVSWREVTVVGQLFDTGDGWPAASFAPAHRPSGIPGWLVEIAVERERSVLMRLDEVETGFDRVRVTTTDGDEAWSYEVADPEPDWVPIDRWRGEAER